MELSWQSQHDSVAALSSLKKLGCYHKFSNGPLPFGTSMLNWCSSRDTCAGPDPSAIRLKPDAYLIVEDAQIAVAAAHHRRRQDCLHFLCDDANVGFVAAVVPEPVEAEAVVKAAKE